MICPSCKSLIKDDAVFCPVCGKPVRQENKNAPAGNGNAGPDAAGAQGQNPQNAQRMRSEAAQGTPRQENGSAAGARNASAGPQNNGGQPGGDAGRAYYGNRQRPDGNRRPNPNAEYNFQRRNVPPYGGQPQGRPGMDARPHIPAADAAEMKKGLRPKALISFIFGIFSICSVTFDLPFGIAGLVLGIIVKKAYERYGLEPDSDLRLAKAGFVCSIIGIVIGAIGIIVLLFAGASIISGLSQLMSLGNNSYY